MQFLLFINLLIICFPIQTMFRTTLSPVLINQTKKLAIQTFKNQMSTKILTSIPDKKTKLQLLEQEVVILMSIKKLNFLKQQQITDLENRIKELEKIEYENNFTLIPHYVFPHYGSPIPMFVPFTYQTKKRKKSY